MKLEKKRALAARTLNVGAGRIVFNTKRLSEIKEAITKQDMKDLHTSKAILVKEKKGKRKIKKRKTRRRDGSIKKKVKTRKRDYVTLTRKLRTHLSNLKTRGKISSEECRKLRKEIRAKDFRNLSHLKERLSLEKEKTK